MAHGECKTKMVNQSKRERNDYGRDRQKKGETEKWTIFECKSSLMNWYEQNYKNWVKIQVKHIVDEQSDRNYKRALAVYLSLFYCCSMDFEKVKWTRVESDAHGKMQYLLKSIHIGTVQLFIYSGQNHYMRIRTTLERDWHIARGNNEKCDQFWCDCYHWAPENVITIPTASEQMKRTKRRKKASYTQTIDKQRSK